MRSKSIEERFWSKVNIQGPHDCWPWIAGRTNRGYGAFRIGIRKINAHRFAWRFLNGDIPDGKIICHHCDNPPCCNPTHLFLGTHKDNHADCIAKHRNHPPKGEHHGCSKITESDVLEIRKMYTEGHRIRDIARCFGLANRHVYQVVSGIIWKHLNHKLSCNMRRAIGKDHGQSIITEEDVLWIRDVYRPRNFSMQKMAKHLGVKVGTVFDVIHHRTWKHI